MQQSPSWEANRFSASQEIPKKFITAFTSAHNLSQFLASKSMQISNIIKTRPLGEEMFHADGLTHRRDETNSRFSEFF